MFPDGERQIYKYFDGRSTVFGDPLLIEERYLRAIAELDVAAIGQQLQREIPPDAPDELVNRIVLTQSDAMNQLLPAIRAAFGVESLDPATGTGLTVQETMDLWDAFQTWRDEKKANSGDSPPSSTPLDIPPDSSSTIPLTAASSTTAPESERSRRPRPSRV